MYSTRTGWCWGARRDLGKCTWVGEQLAELPASCGLAQWSACFPAMLKKNALTLLRLAPHTENASDHRVGCSVLVVVFQRISPRARPGTLLVPTSQTVSM